jgi:hypothetical protein
LNALRSRCGAKVARKRRYAALRNQQLNQFCATTRGSFTPCDESKNRSPLPTSSDIAALSAYFRLHGFRTTINQQCVLRLQSCFAPSTSLFKLLSRIVLRVVYKPSLVSTSRWRQCPCMLRFAWRSRSETGLRLQLLLTACVH